MAATANLLLCDPEAKVLALYPARALIQDQLRKWRAILEPLNLPLGYIDGDVRVDARSEILDTSRVVLMTPDVVL